MADIQPLVTIAIPTYNRESYLKLAIESVLKQTYKNIEVIVSDNCSTDNTELVVSQFDDQRIKYYKQSTNIGMVGNWNFCLEQAEGEFFLLLSDDDILEETAVEWFQSNLADRNNSIAYCRLLFIDSDSKPIKLSRLSPNFETGHQFIINSLSGKRDVFPSAMLHRTEPLRNMGGYPDIGTSTDLAVRLTLATLGNVVFSPTTLIKYRVHDQSLSSAVEKVVDSHKQLIDWVSEETNQLYKYREILRNYTIQMFYNISRTELLRGRKSSSYIAQKALRNLSSSWKHKVFFFCFSLPPVQLLATFRRAIIKKIARVSM